METVYSILRPTILLEYQGEDRAMLEDRKFWSGNAALSARLLRDINLQDGSRLVLPITRAISASSVPWRCHMSE